MPEHLQAAAKYTFYGKEEAREKFFVKGEGVEDGLVGAVEYEAGSLSAYKFVCGLLKLCLKKAKEEERGFEIFTHTPAEEITKEGEIWRVKTKRGTLKAKRVVMATNGYTAFLVPKFHKRIVPFRGQTIAQRPGKDIPKEGLGRTYSFIYGRGYEYMISRPPGSVGEGDIIIGGGLVKCAGEGESQFGVTNDGDLEDSITDYLRGTLKSFFGGAGWGEESRVREWSGIMGESCDGLPFVGRVPGRLRSGIFL